jgi:uncharacterized protein (TIGR00730 family)
MSEPMNSPRITPRVLVFCGARDAGPVFTAAAFAFGQAVAVRGWGIVYGGHHAGMMGAVADGCLAHGGAVTGILPDELIGKEVPPAGIELVRVKDMHARKQAMVERADVIVALPGGYGTLDELFEQLTWRVIGKHSKPIGMLDVSVDGVSYWGPLQTFLDHASGTGFISPAARTLAVMHADVDVLCDHLGLAPCP